MFCSKCGAQLADNACFCTKCGTSTSGPQSDLLRKSTYSSESYFFTCSTFKLVVMSACTLGLYELYWFYKNWVLIKQRSGQKIMPFWRAFFAPIWAYSCFNEMKTAAEQNGIQNSLPIEVLAALFFVLQALWRLPDPYSLLSFLAIVAIVPANTLASQLNQRLIPNFQNNADFKGWNWAALIIGGIIFILSIAGSFMPMESINDINSI